jgi:uncharacterized alkaline shock family protein YloU
MSEGSSSQESPLKSDMGITTVSNAVVSQVAGIAAQEVEKVQMGGGATAAVGGFLQSVTGSVAGSSSGGGNFSKGVTVEVGEEEAAIDLTMAVEYGQSIPRITDAVRRNVINRVENLVGLRVNEVNITVNDVQARNSGLEPGYETRPIGETGVPRPGLFLALQHASLFFWCGRTGDRRDASASADLPNPADACSLNSWEVQTSGGPL